MTLILTSVGRKPDALGVYGAPTMTGTEFPGRPVE